MSILRRYYSDGQIYFITAVTYKRQKILENNYDLLQQSIDNTSKKLLFNLYAHVFLPEHIHLLIDPLANNLSDLMHRIKLSFGMYYRKRHMKPSGRLWQNRFWDHIIRDERDMNQHLHYNPVKHGYTTEALKWPYSSFANYLQIGFYKDVWGQVKNIEFDGEYGEYE